MELSDVIGRLEDFLSGEHDHLWLISDAVYFDGDWEQFQDSFEYCDADLLAANIRTFHEDPSWNWWGSLASPDHENLNDVGVAAFLPVIRVSRPAANALVQGVKGGWLGHPEALVATILNAAGLRIEDIGGTGSFAPGDRVGKWYNGRTFGWNFSPEFEAGKLHYPAPLRQKKLSNLRIRTSPDHDVPDSARPRMLYVSPVGSGAAELLAGTLDCFRNSGADCLLLQYDDSVLALPDDVRVIKAKGGKWNLAIQYLHPDSIAHYDYIFFWDDDLGVGDFDPARFCRIMAMNRLDMAQPAILSPYPLSHPITARRPCPPPWRGSDGVHVIPVVGRMTNFVEIMAPVFAREAWSEFYSYLDAENWSGWGYDFIPLGRKGIVDIMPVVHTRAVSSISEASRQDMIRFLDDQGLFIRHIEEVGLLYEPGACPTQLKEASAP